MPPTYVVDRQSGVRIPWKALTKRERIEFLIERERAEGEGPRSTFFGVRSDAPAPLTCDWTWPSPGSGALEGGEGHTAQTLETWLRARGSSLWQRSFELGRKAVATKDQMIEIIRRLHEWESTAGAGRTITHYYYDRVRSKGSRQRLAPFRLVDPREYPPSSNCRKVYGCTFAELRWEALGEEKRPPPKPKGLRPSAYLTRDEIGPLLQGLSTSQYWAKRPALMKHYSRYFGGRQFPQGHEFVEIYGVSLCEVRDDPKYRVPLEAVKQFVIQHGIKNRYEYDVLRSRLVNKAKKVGDWPTVPLSAVCIEMVDTARLDFPSFRRLDMSEKKQRLSTFGLPDDPNLLLPAGTDLALRILRLAEDSGATGVTADECSAALGVPHQSTSARFHELVVCGCLTVGKIKRSTRMGKGAKVYHLAPNASLVSYVMLRGAARRTGSTSGLSQEDALALSAARQFLDGWPKARTASARKRAVVRLLQQLKSLMIANRMKSAA